MVKISLSDVQRKEINALMMEFIKEKKLEDQIQNLVTLLRDEKYNETADKIDEKICKNKLFLLKDKNELHATIDLFDKAIKKDVENQNLKSEDKILKLLRSEKEEEKKNKDIVKEGIPGFIDFYKLFSKSEQAIKILQILEVNVCPYCNRQYTFTVRNRKNNKDLKSRPQFDHFYPKSKYPYLAISISNLIPCCGLCNQGKSKTDPDKYLYPYEESFEDKGIHFEINAIENVLNNKQIRVSLEPKKQQEQIIRQYNESFKIEELYNMHDKYISELLQKKRIFNEDAIESIYSSYKEIFSDKSEVKQLIFGYESPDNYNQRPLSKLTHDIMEQLK